MKIWSRLLDFDVSHLRRLRMLYSSSMYKNPTAKTKWQRIIIAATAFT